MSLEKSGKKGKIMIGASGLAGVRNWRYNMDPSNQPYSSSSTPGHKKTVAGVKSGKVNGEIVIDFNEYLLDDLKIGVEVTFLLYEDSGEARHYIVPCRLGPVEVTTDVENGTPISASFEADTQGAWTYPDGTVSD